MSEELPINVFDLNKSLQQKETEIELLQQTFSEICSELDLNKIFQIVARRARSLISADTLLIPVINESGQSYTYRGGSGKNATEIVGETLPIYLGVCGWVWKNRRPWWRGVVDELSAEEKTRWEKEAGTMILVPLQGKRQFLGGIAGLNKKGADGFDKKDLNLLQLFAGTVAIAIENAMAVKSIEISHSLNEDYRVRLELLNRQLQESSRELEYLSLYDTVTGLPNRSLFYERLTSEIESIEDRAKKSSGKIGLLLIDIDSFKDVNDTLGHDYGDELLNKVSRRFEDCIENDEFIARLGGDEFVFLLPGMGRLKVLARARQFLRRLEETFTIEKHEIVISASVGIALYPEHGQSISELLSHVDFAMYEAKSSSEFVSVYNPDNDHYAQGHLSMVSDVREALSRSHFELYYQPKINARNGEVCSVEALGRWCSDKHGNVSPRVFISLLEQNGMIHDYTYWAISTALKQARLLKSQGRAMRIAVNLSPQTIMHPEFKKNIDSIITSRDDGELIIFEITENLFLSDFDPLAEVLNHVCAMGVQFSIDDYGTGYSSLSRLRRLPVNELKIDRSFIKDMVDNKDDEVVVHSTIELAHNLGLSVVAEGVENQSSYDLLVRLGCDTIQGFLVSKPLSEKQIEEYILALN